MIEPNECTMVVGIADVAGFTKACKGKSNIETFSILNDFYNLVAIVIGEADGKIIKFMGDSALVVFPEEKAKEAVVCLGGLVSAGDELWSEWDTTCSVRTKAHVGPVVMGPMGPDNHIDVIGNTLNDLFMMPWDKNDMSDELRGLVEE